MKRQQIKFSELSKDDTEDIFDNLFPKIKSVDLVKDEELREEIFNNRRTNSDVITLLNRLISQTQNNQDYYFDIIIRLCGIFQITKNYNSEKLLQMCITELPDSAAPSVLYVCNCLYENRSKTSNIYYYLFETYQRIKNSNNINILQKLDILVKLCYSKKYHNCVKNFVVELLDSDKFDDKFKLSIVNNFLYIKKNTNNSEFDFNLGNTSQRVKLYKYCSYYFFISEKISVEYKLLIASHLIFYNKSRIPNVFSKLEKIGDNTDYEENTRATALDIILKHSKTMEEQNRIRNKIINLGKDNKLNTFYRNTQNVHLDEEIEISSKKILGTLIEEIQIFRDVNTDNINPFKNFPELPEIQEELIKFVELESNDNYFKNKENTKDVINYAIYRFNVDCSLYTFMMTLEKIFKYIYVFIEYCVSDESQKIDLMRRFIDSLEHSYGKCSSGYLTNMLNCLSGYKNFMMRISVKEEFISCMLHKINKKIENDENVENIIDEVAEEKLHNRKNFNKFFIKIFSDVKDEMLEEYKELIKNRDEFDMYFKEGIERYKQ